MTRCAASFLLSLIAAYFFFGGSASAREAAFLKPGVIGGSAGEEAVRVDPKPEIDVGEAAANVAKRTTVFFVNKTTTPVVIEKIVLSSDSLVMAEESANDCQKQGTIAPLSRCSIEVAITPTGFGTWSIDVLMTHNGAGRITRARLFGRTSGSSAADSKSTGLSISAKEIKPVDFGSVDLGSGKVVRSALMVNDSVDPIVLQSIDVIEASNGLQKLTQGCAVDMELQPGASCPVTLLWEPQDVAPVSTDLIIRHTGKLGFTVVPVRGVVKGESDKGKGGSRTSLSKNSVPLPLSAQDIEKEVQGKILPIPNAALNPDNIFPPKNKSPLASNGKLYLIGTIGARALFLLPNGETLVARTGDDVETAEGAGKIISVKANSVDIVIDGKKITLPLEASPSLLSKAVEEQSEKETSRRKATSSSGEDSKR